ncbi:hypothetical protein LTR66_011465 [Elasticomyces elasticus]|nr:hypothetical protein LTR66_011465 [Elasticomyces elasticus]
MPDSAVSSQPSEFQKADWHHDFARDIPFIGSKRGMRLVMLLDSIAGLLSSCWRSVFNKPLDELVSLLGFELPTAPSVDLADIKADGFVLHWEPSDDRKSLVHHEIQLNGVVVGKVPPSETSVSVSNISPEHFYIARVIVVNASDFRAASEPIRFRTKCASSGDFFNDHQGTPIASTPIIRHFPAFGDGQPTPTAPAMAREHSSGQTTGKRSVAIRRSSSAVLGTEDVNSSAEQTEYPYDSEETIGMLTAKLDKLRRETDETEELIQREEDEASQAKNEFIKERDELKSSIKEKEDASKELNKTKNALEAANRKAQNERSAQERLLQQKQAEHRKVHDDVERFARETDEMCTAVTTFESETESHRLESTQKLEHLRMQLAEESQTIKEMEDEIREKGMQIKNFEESSNSPRNVNVIPEESVDGRESSDMLNDDHWHLKHQELQAQYARASQNHDMALAYHQQALERLRYMKQRHAELNNAPSSAPTIGNPPLRHNSHRRRRTPSGRTDTNSSAGGGFPTSTGPAYNGSISSISSNFNSASPFFNINNGMSLGPIAPTNGTLTQVDIEQLTGGAPMSPSAGSLLPSNLLSTAEDDEKETIEGARSLLQRHNSSSTESRQQSFFENRQTSISRDTTMLPGLGAFASEGTIPGLGAPQTLDHVGPGPTSPASVSSRSPSAFASPGASTHNLPWAPPENIADSDGRSVRSTRSNRAASGGPMQGTSKFAQMFGLDKLNRQRGKTMLDDGPALGSLPKSQSHSMPRQEPGGSDFASYLRRRNSSHSGNFLDSMLNRAPAAPKVPPEDGQQSSVATRKRPFNMFSSKFGDWPHAFNSGDRPSSPRPVSTHSTELPRPSQDSQRWGLWPAPETFGQRSSPLSGDWSGLPLPPAPSQSRLWGSRHPSRRPSIQHGPSGLDDLISEDDDQDFLDPEPQPPALQAPIGTMPEGGTRPATPKLNPAAKDFKMLSMFGFDKKADRSKAKEKAKFKDTGGSSSMSTPMSVATPPTAGDATIDNSPPDSRKSRDARSFTTASSSALDPDARNSLERTSSFTASDAAPPTPSSTSTTAAAGPREKQSLMQKLSRKSSSGKFGLPVFNRSASRRADSTPSTTVEDEDDGNNAGGGLSRSVESVGATPREKGREEREGARAGGVRGWSSLLSGKGKIAKRDRERDRDRDRERVREGGRRRGKDDGALTASSVSEASVGDEGPETEDEGRGEEW